MQPTNQQTLALAELNTRAREIFRQIVDAYLVSGAPVGSRTLSKGGLGLSPASIRNVMQDLEELGLLAAPHTSAGRLPTELGLRMFVDGMMQAAEPSQDERAALEAGLAAWSSDAAARPVLIVRGQANLVEDAVDLERVRQLLDDLEDKAELIRLLDRAREAEAARIFIGAESRLFSLSGSSVIAAPYRGNDGKVIGVVGVIGPTRLNYARVIPMVDYTARTLSRLVS